MSLRNDMPTPRVEILEPKAATGIAELTDAGAEEDPPVSKRWVIKPRRAIPKNSSILLKILYGGGSDAAGGQFHVAIDGACSAMESAVPGIRSLTASLHLDGCAMRSPRALYLNLAKVAKKRGDRDRMVWAARNALSADKARGREGDISRQARELLQEQQ